MIAAVVLFWGSLAALAWTHVLYPLTVALTASVVPSITETVSLPKFAT